MRHRIIRGLIAVATVIGLAFGGWYGYERLRPGQTHSTQASYAFDVSDRTKVAGFADHVFVGTVERVVGVQERNDYAVCTVFEVTVKDVLKGRPVRSLRIVQLGGTLGRDTWLVADEPLLRTGTSYVLAVRTDPGRETHLLLGGVDFPVVDLAAVATGRSEAVAVWRTAVSNQRWPEEIAQLKPAEWPN